MENGIIGGNIWVQPALAADDARGGDEEDRGGENEQDAEAGEDSDHLFLQVGVNQVGWWNRLTRLKFKI